MIVGNPRLAVWTASDSTLRIFELATNESSFQQVGTATLNHSVSAPNKPVLAFNDEGTRVFAWHQSSMTFSGSRITLWDFSGVQINDGNFPGIDNGILKGAVTPHSDLFVSIVGYNTINNALRIDDAFAGAHNIAIFGDVPSMAVCESKLFVGKGAANSIIWHADSIDPTYLTPVYSASATLADMAISPTVAAFTPDENWLIAAVNGSIEFWSTIDETYIKTNELTEAGIGNALACAIRYDSKWIALSFNNAGVYTTNIYERVGGFLKKRTTLNTFGKTLQWTADGRYLLDAAQKKAYSRSEAGVFTGADAIMVNLPANITLDAISAHAATPVAYASLYNAAVQPLTLNSIDDANLKIALLDNTATFDATDTSAATILGAEVDGNNWPTGGVTLTGVIFTTGPGALASWQFDPVEQIVAGGDLTYQSLLIYDATFDTPLAFIDYGEDVTIPENVTVTINSLDDTFVKFVP